MGWTDLFPIIEPYKEIIELVLGIIIFWSEPSIPDNKLS